MSNRHHTSDQDEVDSLPSLSSSILDGDEAQQEWEESLEQLQLIMTIFLVPLAGKFLGRKFAYWSWARYMEWLHGVEIRWTNKKQFAASGVAKAAASM